MNMNDSAAFAIVLCVLFLSIMSAIMFTVDKNAETAKAYIEAGMVQTVDPRGYKIWVKPENISTELQVDTE